MISYLKMRGKRVPIARAGNGARKIKLISPKLFFERIQEAEANEAIQSHV